MASRITYDNSRRSFLRSMGLLTLGAALPSLYSFEPPHRKIGLQLYTLRNIMTDANLHEVLASIAAIGYRELEIFGYDEKTKFWGRDPRAFKKLLRSYGLKAPAAHIGFQAFLTSHDIPGFKKICKAAQQVGNKYIVVAWLEEPYRSNAADYRLIAKKLNQAAQIARAFNLKLLYHNHDFEFKAIEGTTTGYDILLQETDNHQVQMELDLYWCAKAGVDPLKLFQRYPGRFPLWHIKDMDAVSKDFTEVGKGTIDFVAIFKAARLAGLQHFFVEQDEIKGDTWQSIRESYHYLRNNNIY
jgi:sugar phosphate isomerase/epimerase